MKQIVQNMKNGETALVDTPTPALKDRQVLIKSTISLVSVGTERMLVEFGKATYIQKAKQQPDKVKQVLGKIQTDGLRPTIQAVFNKLDHPLPLGYSNVGVVIGVGTQIASLKVGDRVVSNGPHAEFVCVPENLTARIPDTVSDESAAFTVVGSIALESIRLCNPTFGESIVVIGLGLIGLLTCELLMANGAHVIAYDLDTEKVNLAKSMGADAFIADSNSVAKVMDLTGKVGADGVIITASAKGDEIIHDAAQMSRKRGRIILLGVIGLNIRRDDFYQKELTFQVSCSYGPGRYDDDYEQKGNDYPLAYVRWTEKRNFEAFLEALARNRIQVEKFVSEVVKLDDYQKIYGDMKRSGIITSLIRYSENIESRSTIPMEPQFISEGEKSIVVVGAGNFVSATMLPILKKLNAHLNYIVSARGLNASALAKKYGISYASTSLSDVLQDSSTDLCIVSTRHDLHARQVIEALSHGKSVFVEKPLCLDQKELDEIIKAKQKSQKMVMVGFNRRYSPLSVKAKYIVGDSLVNINATMNAGFIPSNSWVHDPQIGGGRIVGEACHYIDLCSYFTGSKIVAVCMNSLGPDFNEMTDNATILLKYANGSQAAINYFSNGSKSYAKERIELYSQGRTLIIDNWRSLEAFGVRGFRKVKGKQQKGHLEQFRHLIAHQKADGDSFIPFESIVNTTRASFAALRSLKEHCWIEVE